MSLTETSELCLCLILPEFSNLLLSQCFWNDVWVQNTVRILIINNVSPRIIISALGSDSEPSTTIWSLYHYIYVLRQLALISLNVIRAALLLLIDHWHLVVWAIALHIVQKLLKVWVVIHSGTHLNRFRVLSMLLSADVGSHLREHLLDSGIISWLDHHTSLVVLVDTSVADVLNVSICVSCSLLHTIGHVESLLTIVNGGACRGVTLDISHVDNAAVGWLRVVHANSTCLSREMLWVLGCTNDRANTGFGWSPRLGHTHIEQLHIVVTCHTICGWPHTNRVCSFGINLVYLFLIMIYAIIQVDMTFRRLGGPCRSCVVRPTNTAEETRTDHRSLIHHRLLMIVSTDSLKALRWGTTWWSKIDSW